MSKKEKALAKLRKNAKNVRFEDIDKILMGLGCKKRQKGSHVVYTYQGCPPLTIPIRKPTILPVYVKNVLQFIDQIIPDTSD